MFFKWTHISMWIKLPPCLIIWSSWADVIITTCCLQVNRLFNCNRTKVECSELCLCHSLKIYQVMITCQENVPSLYPFAWIYLRKSWIRWWCWWGRWQLWWGCDDDDYDYTVNWYNSADSSKHVCQCTLRNGFERDKLLAMISFVRLLFDWKTDKTCCVQTVYS